MTLDHLITATSRVENACEETGQPDEILLGDAVAYINARLDKSAEALIEIGQFLLKRFFEDDPEKVGDRAPRKGVSLRKLAEHPDINMSYTSLANTVNLAVQEKQLGTDQTSDQLTASHKVLLLKVEGAQTKKKYIAQIEKDKLSVRRFHELLEKDGLVQRRSLVTIENESESRLRLSGVRKLIDSFEFLSALDLKRLLALPAGDLKIAYDAARKARLRLDAIMNGMEQRLRR